MCIRDSYNPLAMLMERLLATFIPSLVDRDLEEFVQITIKPVSYTHLLLDGT